MDDAGRVTALDSDAAPPVTYAFDLAGRLTSLEASGAVATRGGRVCLDGTV